jgi:hypothetical protein
VGISRKGSVLALLAIGAATVLSGPVAGAQAVPGCDKYASPTGSDFAPGTEAMPYRSVKALVDGLGAGQTGCLRTGTYPGPDNAAPEPTPIYLDAANSTLRNYPGEHASVDARLEVTGAGAKITELTLDSATLNVTVTALKLVGNNSSLSYSNVSGRDRIGTCVQIGTGSTQSSGVVVEHNRITHCGADDSGQNKFDHNIYVAESQGAIIRWNVLRDNAGGWGVHMYPNADGTLVENNMIDSDHGGVVFAGDGTGTKSDNNEVRSNSLTYPDPGGSEPRYNAEGSWSGGPVGTGNRVHDNCIHSSGADSPSGIQNPPSGFTEWNNTVYTAGPGVDPILDGYHVWAQNPCAVPTEALVGPQAP